MTNERMKIDIDGWEDGGWKDNICFNIMRDPRLRSVDKVIASAMLMRHVGRKDHEAFDDPEVIGDAVCVSPQRASRSITRLKGIGWLDHTNRWEDD
jgi:hypothetical protein